MDRNALPQRDIHVIDDVSDHCNATKLESIFLVANVEVRDLT
jgi:hypothetical protein